jgi:hypothetical protein
MTAASGSKTKKNESGGKRNPVKKKGSVPNDALFKEAV